MGRSKRVSDEDVIAKARLAFLAEGHAASTRSIADRVGLSQATLVQRFGTKDALFLAAIQPDALDVEAIIGSEEDAIRDGALGYLASLSARLLERVQDQIPRLLHLRQNPAVGARAVEQAHARLGVPELVRSLRARLAWMQQRRLLSAESPPHQLVDVLLTLIHGVAFMNLVTGQVRPGAVSHLRGLIGAVIGPVTPRRSRPPAKRVRQAKVDRSR